MNRLFAILSLVALALAAIISVQAGLALALVLLTLASSALNPPRSRCCLTTISVPELLPKVLAAFRTQLFDIIGLTTDFSSSTAVKGDVITGHISKLPSLADYDPATGFANGATAAEELLIDVPVTLSNLKHVPVKMPFLTELGSKVSLVPPAENIAYSLVKLIIDDILAKAILNVSNSILISPASMDLPGFEALRSQANSQKMGSPRFCVLNSVLATALGNDGAIQSNLYYGQRNGEEGLRRWKNVAGFSSTIEYPDFPVGTYGGLAFDRRLACLSVRAIADMTNIARELNIPEVMGFERASDTESGLTLTAVKWQQPGTGDTYLSFAILYGLHVGTGGGSPLDKTDLAGCLIRTA